VTSRCEEVAARLPAIIDDRAAVGSDVIDHVEHCLRCQAELARYKKLLRLLSGLRSEGCEPPPGLVGDVLYAVRGAARRHAVRSALAGRRVAYLSGLGVGLVAMAGVVVITRARAGRGATALGS
jgi:hypothetical protein